MKRADLITALLCLCLLAGCGVSGSAGGRTAEEPPASITKEVCSETFRVIRERENSLLLVKNGGERWDVLTVSLTDVFLTLDGAVFDIGEPGAYQDLPGGHLEGALVEIVYGSVQETYPGHLAEVSSVNILTEGFDDRCALYTQVLNDLWDTDPALNADITTVSVDLSQTGLMPGEQEAVAMAFSWDHAIPEYLTLSYAELKEQGCLSCADGSCDGIPHWEDGVLLVITEKESDAVYNTTASGFPAEALTFDAEKWRSALGAYFFSDCTAARDSAGHWGRYTVGAEAIA